MDNQQQLGFEAVVRLLAQQPNAKAKKPSEDTFLVVDEHGFLAWENDGGYREPAIFRAQDVLSTWTVKA